jgi:sigma-B regulation protein RsbU (phosphoserine phosphatase)
MSAEERRRLGRDLELAGEFQAALLPPADLHVAGWELALHYQPLGTLSGDTCDLVLPDDDGDSFHFLLGDVAGKGVSASLLMAHLHALYRSMLVLGLPLAETMGRVNRLFCQSTTTGAYATAVAGRVERSGRVELCNAGHPQPILLGANAAAACAPRSLPLGLFPAAEYRSFELALGEGEGLVLYTDGLSEADNAAGDEYGHARICGALAAVGVASARDTVAAMLADLGRWSGTAALGDDLTVLALRRLEA